MSFKIKETIEIGANISILLVAIFFGLLLIQSYFSSSVNSQKSLSEIKKGTKVNVPNVDWEKNEKTLVLYLRKGCKFCTESMPFYQKLAEVGAEKNTKFVVVSPDSTEVSKGYLAEHDVSISEIRQSSLVTLGVRGTPTLILTNEKGEVSNSWIGKLPSEKEQEVINQL